MKRIIALASIPCLALLLAGCVAGGGVKITNIHKISQVSLADGSATKVGYKAPQPAWQCTPIAQTSETWSTDKVKAMADWHGPYIILQNHAIAYANEHQLKPDYIYLRVPVEVAIGGISADPFAQAYMNYYQCKYPPAISNRLL